MHNVKSIIRYFKKALTIKYTSPEIQMKPLHILLIYESEKERFHDESCEVLGLYYLYKLTCVESGFRNNIQQFERLFVK